MIKLPEKIEFIFDVLNRNGYICYAVGGCVRDLLMGKTPTDYDFTTDATPEEIISCFSEYKTVDTGIKFGTVSVVADGEMYEITTFRFDGKYTDNRHPDNVSFSKRVEDDLSRRDFTVNSIACSPDGKIIDPYGGLDDIKNKVIRTTGDAVKRFNEDSLRILRALRFSAKLDFRIDDATKSAIHLCKDNLSSVHPQRIRKELEGILLSNIKSDLFLEYTDVLTCIIPDIKPVITLEQINPHHMYTVWKHTVKALENTPMDLEIRLAILLHDLGKAKSRTTDKNGIDHFKGHQIISAEIAKTVLTRFGFSSDLVSNVVTLIKYHDERFKKGDMDIKRVLGDIDSVLFFKLMDVRVADTLAQSKYRREEKLNSILNVKRRAKEILDLGECIKISQLTVNGNDVADCGFSGREIGEKLNMLLKMVISGECENQRDVLIKILKECSSTI